MNYKSKLSEKEILYEVLNCQEAHCKCVIAKDEVRQKPRSVGAKYVYCVILEIKFQLVKYIILNSLRNFETPPARLSVIQKTKKIIKKGVSICFSAEKEGNNVSQTDLYDRLREIKNDMQAKENELRKLSDILLMKLSDNKHTPLHKDSLLKNSDNFLIVATFPNTVLSQEDANNGFGYLYSLFENPALQGLTLSGRKRIHLDKEMIKVLEELAQRTQELIKENPGLIMNVVRSDMFENALHTSNVETKTLGYTLLFTKEDRMPLVLPIYDKGYISEKDCEDNKHREISHKRKKSTGWQI